MPYIYAQASLASREGHPMVRALFFEYPEDPTSWLIEDQYLFGTELLVAPLMEEAPDREVYLPQDRGSTTKAERSTRALAGTTCRWGSCLWRSSSGTGPSSHTRTWRKARVRSTGTH
jgi:hypothetical protein